MDRDPNYVAVGAFVLLVLVLGVSFVFWYTGQQDQHSYQRYEIYFQGSVSGLSPGSPVRYLGVDVGKVVRISLDPKQRKRVQVLADIDATAPLDAGTRASLNMQGVTGVLYIDLQEDPRLATGPLPQGQNYPVVGSAKSSIDVLLANLPDLTGRMAELVEHLNQVFGDDNVAALKSTLANARLASEQLPATIHDLQALLGETRHAAQEVQSTVADLHGVVQRTGPDIGSALANIRQVSETLARTAGRLDAFVVGNEPGLSRFTSQSLPEFEQLLRESRQAARDFRDLSRSLKANPSQLIYESSSRGVEIPR